MTNFKSARDSARDIFARDISKVPVTIFEKVPVTNLKNQMSRAQ